MFDYKIIRENGMVKVSTNLKGKALLTIPQLNKGTAFTIQERLDFELMGKLPLKVETLSEQVSRCYMQFNQYTQPFKKNVFLNNLLNTNQVLFYALITEYLVEMLPYIYTPVVGAAVQEFSHEFRQPRGLYIAYPDIDYIDIMLSNRTNKEIDVIVVTDGEGVLGIGDQGLGGADIPVAKSMVYTACAGIDPNRTLPIFLDVGTNNKTLLEDPMYIGWRKERLEGAPYKDFIEKFVSSVKKHFPHVLLHWEDFAREKAHYNLSFYRDRILSFNDDIQGTGVVASAAVMAVSHITQVPLDKQKIVIFGAGAAGTGIANQIMVTMMQAGISEQKARDVFYLIDKNGLVVVGQDHLTDTQKQFARSKKLVSKWPCKNADNIRLIEVIKQVQPTILIGASGVSGAFTKDIIQTMADHVETPAVLPLSNPVDCVEVEPKDLIHWTNGNVLISTGSPFEPVYFNNRKYDISQCNNALAFPGIGLGAIIAKARRISDNMLYAASVAISDYTVRNGGSNMALLPSIADSTKLAKHIACAVIKTAIQDGDCGVAIELDAIENCVNAAFWIPQYMPFENNGQD